MYALEKDLTWFARRAKTLKAKNSRSYKFIVIALRDLSLSQRFILGFMSSWMNRSVDGGVFTVLVKNKKFLASSSSVSSSLSLFLAASFFKMKALCSYKT